VLSLVSFGLSTFAAQLALFTLEIVVAVVQAYVFTMLVALYLRESIWDFGLTRALWFEFSVAPFVLLWWFDEGL